MKDFTKELVSVSDLISIQGLNRPDSIALEDGERRLNFRDLDRLADQFSHYLAQLGVGRGGTVVLCLERSFDWVVAALGIMRTGAAYVPLDISWPESRLRHAVEDSGATVVVARATLLERLSLNSRGVDPTRDARAIADAPEQPNVLIEPDNLAYVIYTSGSTGVPKGVEITHANLAHLIQWQSSQFNVSPGDRVSHLIGLGFDASILEVWPHLCSGATLCFVDEATRNSADLIQKWMVREFLTIGIVPAVYGASLIEMTWPETTKLRLLIMGGDVLHRRPSHGLPFKVVNNYGPTECTVTSTWALLEPGEESIPPIGVPIAGATIYLLNEDRIPVDDGEIGEIYIGGPGVGRGYRNMSQLTEQFFLHDPFQSAPNARMYRTGDLAKRLPDGNLQFNGRLDRQVKIFGNRVELEEIDIFLNRHPSVSFAATKVYHEERGENQLVSYVLPKEDGVDLSMAELQTYLLRYLPDYMVPGVFVRLREIPLSANGKIEMSALPKPSNENRLDAANEPENPVEEELLKMVRQLIKSETISTGDNFFLVGGHSLLAMQLLMRLRQIYNIDLTLPELFQASTVSRLSKIVETKIVDSIDQLSDEDAESQLTE